MIHDDWVFVEMHGIRGIDIWEWFRWYFAYCVLPFSFYYWLVALAVIFVCRRMARVRQSRRDGLVVAVVRALTYHKAHYPPPSLR